MIQEILYSIFLCIALVLCFTKKTDLVSIILFALILALGSKFITNDISFYTVYANSHYTDPLLYRIAAIWSSHEGSMLLWTFMLSLYGSLLTRTTKTTSLQTISKVYFALCATFIAYTLIAANPFIQIDTSQISQGLGLNPLLQDIAVSIHPPILYMGYSGLGIVFSIGLYSLINVQKLNISILKLWLFPSWGFLTLGVGLGSWWAYRELGWGGFWFWDPVENIALMPWLICVAALHTLQLSTKHSILYRWSIFLSMLPFISLMLGTMVIRTGILTSVHTFSIDKESSIITVLFCSIIVMFSLSLFALRIHKISATKRIKFNLFSSEANLLFNNIIFITLYVILFLGVSYPIFYEVITGNKISIGEPYYHLTFVRIATPMTILASLRGNIKRIMLNYFVALSISLLAAKNYEYITIISLSASIALILSIVDFNALAHPDKSKVIMIISHLGLGVLSLGLVINTFWSTETEKYLMPKDQISLNNYVLTLEGLSVDNALNYNAIKAIFISENKQKIIAESRIYNTTNTLTTKMGCLHSIFSDMNITIGSINEEKGLAIRFQYTAGINLIWLGCILISLSSFVGTYIHAMSYRKKYFSGN